MKLRPFNLCALKLKTMIDYTEEGKQLKLSFKNLNEGEFNYIEIGNTLFNDFTIPNWYFTPGTQGLFV